MTNIEPVTAPRSIATDGPEQERSASGPSRESLSYRHAFGWASGAFGQAVAFYAFGVLLLRYLTDTVGITAAIAGLLIGGSKLVDGFIDPAIGNASDKTAGRFGRRRPWMFAGGILLGASVIVLFNMPVLESPAARIGFVAFGLFLYSVGFSCFSIPWLAMPAEITMDYHGRSFMMAARVFAMAAGQAAAAGIAAIILASELRTKMDYSRLGLTLGVLAGVAMIVTVATLRGAPATARESASRPGLTAQLRSALANRPFLVVLGLKFCGFFAVTIQSSSMAYFTTHVLHLSDSWLASFFIALTLGMIASQPIWLMASRRFDKKATLSVAMAMQGLFYFSLSFDLIESSFWLVAHGVLLGISGGGIFQLTQSMLPDTLEHDFHRTGMRREGSLTGLGAFVEKTSSALGVATIGFLLSASGYVAGAAASGAAQPDSALIAVRIGACFAPAALLLAGLLMLQYYRLSEDDLKAGREAADGSSPHPRSA